MTPNADQNNDPLDRELEELKMGTPEPPPGFAATVMRQIVHVQAGLSAWRRWRRSVRGANLLRTIGVDKADVENRAVSGWHDAAPGGVIMRKMLWIVAGLGAAVIASSVFLGFPPTGRGTEATIGGAQRYQATPSSTPAVATSSVQDFLQTDTFDRVMKSKESRAILRKAATDPSYRALFEDQALLARVASPELQRLMAEKAFEEAMTRGSLEASAREASLHRLAADPAFARMLADHSSQRLLGEPAFVEALNSVEFRKILADSDMKHAIASPAAARAMSEVAMRLNISRLELEKAVTEAAFVRMAREASFVNRLTDRSFVALLGDQSLLRLMSVPAFHDVMLKPELMRLFSDKSFLALAREQGFVQSMQVAGFRELLLQPGLARMMGDAAFVNRIQAE